MLHSLPPGRTMGSRQMTSHTVSLEELHAIIELLRLAHGIVGTIFKIGGILLTSWHLWILLVMHIY